MNALRSKLHHHFRTSDSVIFFVALLIGLFHVFIGQELTTKNEVMSEIGTIIVGLAFLNFLFAVYCIYTANSNNQRNSH